MRTQTVNWKDFMSGEAERPHCYLIDIASMKSVASGSLLDKGTLIKIAGITFIVLVAMPTVSFAASGTGIDARADKVYKKLLNVAKWVICFKGGIDTIKKVADGDLESAKKSFLGYGVTYAILWGLPWMMQEIDKLFAEMNT